MSADPATAAVADSARANANAKTRQHVPHLHPHDEIEQLGMRKRPAMTATARNPTAIPGCARCRPWRRSRPTPPRDDAEDHQSQDIVDHRRPDDDPGLLAGHSSKIREYPGRNPDGGRGERGTDEDTLGDAIARGNRR